MKLTPTHSRAFLRLQLQVIATEADFLFGPDMTFQNTSACRSLAM
jgi:hypothetical protein